MSVKYARVDAVVGSDVTLTVIEGTATESGAIVFGDVISPRTEMLPASSKALIKPSLVGKVVRVEGFPSLYVTKRWWVGTQYITNSTYELNATSLTVYSDSRCADTTHTRVKIPFAIDQSLRLTMCKANGVTWVFSKGSIAYNVISVRSVSGTWFLKPTPLKADRWGRTTASWTPGALEVVYDVRDDGKPAFAAKLSF